MIEYFDERKQSMWGSIGELTEKEKVHLHQLASQVYEIGQKENQHQKIALHTAHNDLKNSPPVLLAFLDQSAWNELVPPQTLMIKDPFWRSYELFFCREIYREQNIKDDFVITPYLEVPLVYRRSNWGIEIEHIHAKDAGEGAWGFRQSLTDWNMLEKMKDVQIEVDQALTKRNFEAVQAMLQDVIPVTQSKVIPIRPCILRDLAEMRGLEQLMYDLADEPEMVHQALKFMSNSYLKLIEQLEKQKLIEPNNKNDYVGSGGVGYTQSILPKKGEDISCANMWGFGEAQELALVSPEMYEEFALQYLKPILNRFGLNAFACCESLNGKYKSLKKVHNLRRVSISPWSNLAEAAEELEDKYIISWKPDPSQLVQGFDLTRSRNILTDAANITKGCHLEIIMKDLITVNKDIRPLQQWLQAAREIIKGD